MKFLIINGPNMNMLGIREPDLYGTLTYDGLVEYVRPRRGGWAWKRSFTSRTARGTLLRPFSRRMGAWTASSSTPGLIRIRRVAILDALKAVSLPAAEVHISDVTKREAFRQVSYLGMACCCKFAGEGKQGYVHAMEKLIEIIRNKNT